MARKKKSFDAGSAENRSDNNGFGVTDQQRERHHELAHRLLCAFVSHKGNIAYRTYEDLHAGGRDGESWRISREKNLKLPGPYWYWLASEVERQQAELMELGREIAEAKVAEEERKRAGHRDPAPRQFVRSGSTRSESGQPE